MPRKDQNMDIFRERLASRIEWAKLEKGISEAEIGRRLKMDPRRFNKYKTTTREPCYDMLVKICLILDTHPNYLLGVDDNPQWPSEDPLEEINRKLNKIIDT